MVPAAERGDFYVICSDNEVTRDVDEKRNQWNADDLIKNRPVLSRWQPEFKQVYADFVDEQG